jgi:hypothetical protein
MMRAVSESWFGSTDIFIDTEDAIILLAGIADQLAPPATMGENTERVDEGETTDLVFFEHAARPFLDLLDDPVALRAAAARAVAEHELDVDHEDLDYLLGNLHVDRAQYREAYLRDGDVLRFRLD